MYGLKNISRIAFDNFVKLIAPHDFTVQEYSGLWKHPTRSTMFTLYVDSFGIKPNSMEDANHLTNAFRKYFKWSIDWESQNYLSLTLGWNYAKKYVDISMPVYIQNALHTFQQKPPARSQDYSHT